MPARARTDEAAVTEMLKLLTSHGDQTISDEDKLAFLLHHRDQSEAMSREIDRQMLRLLSRSQGVIEELRSSRDQLKQIIDKLTAFPWHPATFVQIEPTTDGSRALVLHGNSTRLVGAAEGLDITGLVRGDSVYLTHEGNAILAIAPHPIWQFGDLATFERLTSDGRAILNCGDTSKVVELVGSLRPEELKRGDLVRARPEIGLAFERIESAGGEHLLLEETPSETFNDIGGLDTQIEQIKRAAVLHLLHPEVVQRYGLRRAGSVLLEGPPGTGKTLIARALANFLSGFSRAGQLSGGVSFRTSTGLSQPGRHHRHVLR